VNKDLTSDPADRNAICELYGWPQTFVGKQFANHPGHIG
jgi:hypothetical protein